MLTADVAGMGPQVESHERFPQRVNAGFIRVWMKHMRAYVYLNGGVGETLACGTGACAAAISTDAPWFTCQCCGNWIGWWQVTN